APAAAMPPRPATCPTTPRACSASSEQAGGIHDPRRAPGPGVPAPPLVGASGPVLLVGRRGSRYRCRMNEPTAGPFRRSTSLDRLNELSRGTAMEPLGIRFTEIGPDFLRGTMPVDERTKQPYG